jgi:hypothetical protein
MPRLSSTVIFCDLGSRTQDGYMHEYRFTIYLAIRHMDTFSHDPRPSDVDPVSRAVHTQ